MLTLNEDLVSKTALRSDLSTKPNLLSSKLTGSTKYTSLTGSGMSTSPLQIQSKLATKSSLPLTRTLGSSGIASSSMSGVSQLKTLNKLPNLLPPTSIKTSPKTSSLLVTRVTPSTLPKTSTSFLTTVSKTNKTSLSTQSKTPGLLQSKTPGLLQSKASSLLASSKAVAAAKPSQIRTTTPTNLLTSKLTVSKAIPELSTQISTEVKEKLHHSGLSAKKEVPASEEDAEIELPITNSTEGAPKYSLSTTTLQTKKPVQFLSPDMDATLQSSPAAAVDIVGLKTTMLNAVAASLLASPDFHDSKDQSLRSLSALGEKIACYDPEFVLKVAIYTRLNLNIRTTANFLLALAAKLPNCRPYLKKYFSASIRLPSDWIEVAEIYQALHDTTIKHGSIPTALRKVMCAKFSNFDAFQLAKYNKDGTKKKKKSKKLEREKKSEEKKTKKYESDFPVLRALTEESDSDSEDSNSSVVLSDSENKEDLEKLSFTLKQLIRKIHICDPVEHVMSLVGKKYPDDPEAFRKSRLPGMWDESRAGKRMKLAVPETWETQVSTKGNKASTWEELIDHNKLPFMAMLRNIRNLIMAGVKAKYHVWVMKKLSDEYAVTGSRQFPFRFFSAYQVLDELEKIANGEIVPQRAQSKGKDKGKGKKGKKTPKVTPSIDLKLLQRYKNALDTALKISTCYNVKPIGGSTLILCNVGSNMDRPCTAARGLGKPRKVVEVAVLLGLMCKYSCEDCTMLLYGQSGTSTEVELKEGTILHNMEQVMSTAVGGSLSSQAGEIPIQLLMELIVDRKQVDNVVILTDTMKLDDQQGKMMMDFLKKYRHLVNPNLLFVSVDLSAGKTGVSSTITPQHPNDIYLAGYSDQILRFIAERGDSGQLTYVDNIDKVHNLTHIKIPSLADSAISGTPNTLSALAAEKAFLSAARGQKWRTVRVFISSTFRDMHGERDLLTRFVFPELRARAYSRQIHVYEVDLRWGVTETDSRSHKALEICLEEIAKSQYFVGLLGERYGWIQEEYNVSDVPEFDWLKEFPKGRSITEVEMHHAALRDIDKAVGKAFFYFRDPSFLRYVTPDICEDFDAESDEVLRKMEDLKSNIRESQLEVYDDYPCKWLGKIQGKPMVGDLEKFGERVLYNLWNAIQRDYPEDEAEEDEITIAAAQHSSFEESRANTFIGRRALLMKAKQVMDDPDNRLVLVIGKPGCGKSAFMAAVAQQYTASASFSVNPVLSHFVGAAPGSSNIALVLTRFCHELKRRFGVEKSVPEDYTDLARDWPSFLEEAVTNLGKVGFRIVVMIDGTDLLEDKHNGRSLDWIPASIPEGVLILVSGVDGGACAANLRKRKNPPTEISIGPLDMFDKAEMVRNKLGKHRKKLDESPFNNQMKLLLTKKEAINPLYLHLACEELRFFGVFEEVTDYLKKIPTTISNLLQEILQRLEQEHSPGLLSTALLLLTLVRNGLLEHELAGVLKLAGQESAIHAWNLTPMMMSKLLRNLQTFLQPTGEEEMGLLILAHKDIEKAVKLRYMRGADSTRGLTLHKLLSKYFRSQADPNSDGSFKGNSARAFIELPYHLMEAGVWKELELLVCDMNFVIAKCEFGQAHQLLEDYMPATEGISSGKARELNKYIQQPAIQEFKSFVSRNLHVLLQNPSLALQQALNEPNASCIASSAKDIMDEQPRSTMVWVNKPEIVSPCLMNLPSSTGPVLCVTVSNNSTHFAAGFKNGAVKMYEVATGKEVHTFIGHAGGIADICFVGSDTVCSASHDSTLSLWNTIQGIRIASMRGHNRPVYGCTADKAGRLVVSVSWDTTIKVWDGRTGKQKGTLKTPGKHNTPINCVSFHPEGQLVVVGSWDTTLKIWDTLNEKRLKVLKGHKTSVQVCEYAPSGRHIVSAALDGEVKVWSTKSGTAVGTIVGHHSPVNGIAFTPNGQYLVTGSSDKMVKVWSGTMGRPISSIGSESLGFVHRLVYNHIDQLITVGYHDGHVRQFNFHSRAEVFAARHHQAAIVGLAEHSEFFMSASADGSIKVWKTSPNDSIELKGHSAPITCAVWDKNGFASASEDFTIIVWPHEHSKYASKFSSRNRKVPKKGRSKAKPSPPSPSGPVVLQQSPSFQTHGQHTGKITAIAFSCDGLKMAVAGQDRKITVWNCLGNTLEKTLTDCHKDWITCCCFSDLSSNILITGSSDFTLKTWDIYTGAEKTTFKGHTSAINDVAMSQGCVVSGAFDGSVKVWTHKAVEITTMYCHKQRVNACHIHISDKTQNKVAGSAWADMDDGESNNSKLKLGEILVMTGSDDGTVRVWKPFLPNEVATLTGHSDRVLDVATTLNNQVLSSSLDCSLRTWKFLQPTSNMSVVSSSSGHNGPVTSLSGINIGEEESFIVSGGRDGYSVVWKMDKQSFEKFYEVKESDKAVTAVCLLTCTRNQDGEFAVGSSTGSFSTYKFSSKQAPHKKVKIAPNALFGSYPVSKLALGSDKKTVYAGSWSSAIGAIEENGKLTARDTNYSDWVMDFLILSDKLYSVSLNDQVNIWNIPTKKPTSGGTKGYPLRLSNKEGRLGVWPMSLCVVQGTAYIAIADSKGQVSLWGKETYRIHLTKKVHSKTVNVVSPLTEQCFLTGSDDGTVKAWRVAKGPKLIQIGQFYGQSCITAIATIEGYQRKSKHSPARFAVGDSLGHVTLLQWQE